MSNGWEELDCDFFYTTCVDKLAPYFEKAGFQAESASNGVLFRRWGCYVEVGYEPITSPKYAPVVIVGPGEHKYTSSGAPNGVPAWFLIKDNSRYRDYSTWRFRSASELELVLELLLARIITPYIEPLIERTELLEVRLAEFQAYCSKNL